MADLYAIEDGAAYAVTDSFDACAPKTCSEDANECPEKSESCVGNVCVPNACTNDEECGSGSICHDGGCRTTCTESATCGAWDCVSVQRDDEASMICQPHCLRLAEGRIAINYDTSVVLSTSPSRGVDVTNGGAGDFLAVHAEQHVEHHDEQNILLTAAARTPQAFGLDAFIDRRRATSDLSTLPFFCMQPQTQPDDELPNDEMVDSDCIPVGYVDTDNGLIEETELERSERLWNRVDTLEEIQSKPVTSGLVPTQAFTLSFEGTIPRSESRTGKFSQRDSDDEWVMLDYNADFCNLGVEAGDMVHVVRFVPEAADIEECAQFDLTGIVAPPGQYLDPIRYRILEVGRQKLRLARDDRTELFQVARGRGFEPPTLGPSLGAPSRRCAAQLFSYSVRVGHDQWLLTGSQSGYRHPWVSNGGACVRDQVG